MTAPDLDALKDWLANRIGDIEAGRWSTAIPSDVVMAAIRALEPDIRAIGGFICNFENETQIYIEFTRPNGDDHTLEFNENEMWFCNLSRLQDGCRSWTRPGLDVALMREFLQRGEIDGVEDDDRP